MPPPAAIKQVPHDAGLGIGAKIDMVYTGLVSSSSCPYSNFYAQLCFRQR